MRLYYRMFGMAVMCILGLMRGLLRICIRKALSTLSSIVNSLAEYNQLLADETSAILFVC